MKKIITILNFILISLTMSACSSAKVSGEEPVLLEYDTEEIMKQVKERLSTICNENCISFAFVPDLHYENNLYYQSSAVKLVEDLNEINDIYPISGVFLGGDNMGNSYDRVKLKEDTKNMVETFRAMNPPVFVIKGNHDDNSLRGRIENKNESVINAEIAEQDLTQLYSNGIEKGQANSLYSYIDFADQKVRIIYLNSIDVPYILDGEKIRYPGQWCYGYQQEQLDFLVNDALNFENKDDSNGWKAVILQHLSAVNQFTDAPVNNGEVFWGIIEAFRNSSTYNITKQGDFAVNINADFTNQAKGNIIGIIQGHLHRDKEDVYQGTHIIATKKSGLLEDEELGFSMDLFTIDVEKQKIYSTRYGNGENREWDF